MAVSQSPTYYMYTDLDYFSSWLITVAAMKHPPLVISISYSIYEMYVTNSELDAFNVQAIKLGVMGVTLITAAG